MPTLDATFMPGLSRKSDKDNDQAGDVDLDPLATTGLVNVDAPFKQIETALESAEEELRDILYREQNPSQSSTERPEDVEKRKEFLQNTIQGLRKVMGQRQYGMRDYFLPAQAKAMRDLNLLTHPATESQTTNSTRTFTDGDNMIENAVGMGKGAAVADKKTKKPIAKGAYSKSMSKTCVDLQELKTVLFFEGFSDELAKLGFYVDRPLEFFAGMYEGVRHRFEPAEKRAAFGQYSDIVASAAKNFLLSQLEVVKIAAMTKVADMPPMGAGNTTGLGPKPLGPIQLPQMGKIPTPKAPQIQVPNSMPGVDPMRMERRQDLIDEMLPNAQSIELDPDGGIKLKMPDQVAQAMKAKSMEMKLHQQAQQAAQPPQPVQAPQAGQAPASGAVAPQNEVQPQAGAQGGVAEAPMQGGDVGGASLPQTFGLPGA